MKEMIKMMVVLSVICGLSGLTLAALKNATEARIEEQVLTYVQAPSLTQVLHDYDNNPIKDRKKFARPGAEDEITLFPAMKDGKLTGLAFEIFGKGYGGNIGVMVGFDTASGNLSGIGITTMKETPGIGARIAKHGFTSQFKGLSPGRARLKAHNGDIDAIAGATISSTGTVTAVQEAAKLFDALKPEIAKTWP